MFISCFCRYVQCGYWDIFEISLEFPHPFWEELSSSCQSQVPLKRWENPSKKRRKKPLLSGSAGTCEQPIEMISPLWTGTWLCLVTQSPSWTHQQMGHSWIFHHSEASRAWFLDCWASAPTEASAPNTLGIIAPSQVQSGEPQAVITERNSLKNHSTGWICHSCGALHVSLGTQDQMVTSCFCCVPFPGPFINTDVPSPLTKIIHEKIQ